MYNRTKDKIYEADTGKPKISQVLYPHDIVEYHNPKTGHKGKCMLRASKHFHDVGWTVVDEPSNTFYGETFTQNVEILKVWNKEGVLIYECSNN